MSIFVKVEITFQIISIRLEYLKPYDWKLLVLDWNTWNQMTENY